MTTKVVEKAKVDENGTISGLEAHKGADVYVISPPRLDEGRSKEAVEELVRYVKAHRELAEKQYRDFTARFGRPSERFREIAKDLAPDELSRRTKELAEYAERRAAEVRREAEDAWRRLEKEVETRAETLFRKERAAPKNDGARRAEPRASVVLDEQAAAGSVENRAEREF